MRAKYIINGLKVDSILATTLAATGVGLLVIGSMGIAGTLGVHTVAWITFGFSLAPTALVLSNRGFSLPIVIMSLIMPILAALSSYGFIPIATVAALAVAQGGGRLLYLSYFLNRTGEDRNLIFRIA